MMSKSRTKSSMVNGAYSIITYFVILILQMLNRLVFVKYLPIEYLGINGLFSNILSILSLSELGIGTAISYSLYKPLKENNFSKVSAIMAVYKRLYNSIGLFIFLTGCLLIPVLGNLIKDIPNFVSMKQVTIFYLIYLINTSISYFASYKRTLLICDQKQYITNLINLVSKILLTISQIAILITSHNYICYLFVMVVATIFENFMLTFVANKSYPDVKSNQNGLESETKSELKRNILAMFFHRFGDVVINATDNIIITKFASLALTGIYSNYLVIINAAKGILSQLFSSITASVGNLLVSTNKEKSYYIFNKLLFLNYILYSLSSVLIFVLINDFISIWIGRNFLLSNFTVFILSITFYITGMQKTVRIFRDAAGVFYYDRYKPILEACVNLIISIPFTIKFGIAGTVIGTLLSCLLVSFWIEAIVLFKNEFAKSVKKYFILQIKYFFEFATISAVFKFATTIISTEGIFGIMLKTIIVMGGYLVTIFVIYHKSDNFEYYKSILNKILIVKR